MKFKRAFTFLSTLVILGSMIGVQPVTAASQQAGGSPFIRQISSAITTSFPAGNAGPEANGVQTPETWAQARAAQARGILASNDNQTLVGRMKSLENGEDSSDPLWAPRAEGSNIAGSNRGLFTSFRG